MEEWLTYSNITKNKILPQREFGYKTKLHGEYLKTTTKLGQS
jgi:hypothetical protein